MATRLFSAGRLSYPVHVRVMPIGNRRNDEFRQVLCVPVDYHLFETFDLCVGGLKDH
ncbi:MAG: hypothetical protein K9N52_06780 [Verrucomicrobia bacterium]|nr:hypothetical protein [Verrucomicrobiota bacterium]